MATETFAFNVQRFAEKIGVGLDDTIRKVLFEMSASLVLKSPVGKPSLWKSKRAPKGYVGGRFRANWFYGTDVAPSTTTKDIDKSGASTINRLRSTIGNGPLVGRIHWFANNLPYALRLEHGWSTQTPAGMVKITAVEFVNFYDRAVTTLK